jgi:hypothetical protein
MSLTLELDLDKTAQKNLQRLCTIPRRSKEHYIVNMIKREISDRKSHLERTMVLEALERMHQIADFHGMAKYVLIQDLAREVNSTFGLNLSSNKVSGYLRQLGLSERKRKAGSGLSQVVLRYRYYKRLLEQYQIKPTVWTMRI